MTQETFPGVYVAEIETGMVGVYHLDYGFLCGAAGECSVLIDCGFPEKADPPCGIALRGVMRTLGFHPGGLDMLIMHGYKDHLRQTRALATEGVRIFVNLEDMDQSAILNTFLMDRVGWRQLSRSVGLKAYDREIYEALWQAADYFSKGYEGVWDFSYLLIRPGDCRQIGDHRPEATTLPGHMRGELGFFVWAQKLIFSGDHILEEVAPIASNIGGFPNALSSYTTSFGEAAARSSDYLFVSGHGAPFRSPRTAVKKTIRYYHRHCESLYHIVRAVEEPLLLRDIGAVVYRRCQRPLMEKGREVRIQIWFKTYICPKYLEEQEALREEIEEGAFYWQSPQ